MNVFLLRTCEDHADGHTLGIFSTLVAAKERAELYRWQERWTWTKFQDFEWLGGLPGWPEYEVTQHMLED